MQNIKKQINLTDVNKVSVKQRDGKWDIFYETSHKKLVGKAVSLDGSTLKLKVELCDFVDCSEEMKKEVENKILHKTENKS